MTAEIGQARAVTSDFGGWTPPSAHNPTGQPSLGQPFGQPTTLQASPTMPPGEVYSPSVPLGGQPPVYIVEEPRSDRMAILLGVFLMVSSIVIALATTFEWRDYGNRAVGVYETGWTQANGSLGRAWIVVVIAIIWSVGGMLIVTNRKRLGRRLAVWSAALGVLYAVIEWGFGVGELRSGPGIGLWFVMGIAALVMLILGGYDPDSTPS